MHDSRTRSMNGVIIERNRLYMEDSKRVYSVLEELLLGTDGYEWLDVAEMKTRDDTKSFSNLRTHYDGSTAHIKGVAEENKILDEIYYKNAGKKVAIYGGLIIAIFVAIRFIFGN